MSNHNPCAIDVDEFKDKIIEFKQSNLGAYSVYVAVGNDYDPFVEKFDNDKMIYTLFSKSDFGNQFPIPKEEFSVGNNRIADIKGYNLALSKLIENKKVRQILEAVYGEYYSITFDLASKKKDNIDDIWSPGYAVRGAEDQIAIIVTTDSNPITKGYTIISPILPDKTLPVFTWKIVGDAKMDDIFDYFKVHLEESQIFMVEIMRKSKLFKKAFENKNYVFVFNVIIAAQVALGVSGFNFGTGSNVQKAALEKMKDYAKEAGNSNPSDVLKKLNQNIAKTSVNQVTKRIYGYFYAAVKILEEQGYKKIYDFSQLSLLYLSKIFYFGEQLKIPKASSSLPIPVATQINGIQLYEKDFDSLRNDRGWLTSAIINCVIAKFVESSDDGWSAAPSDLYASITLDAKFHNHVGVYPELFLDKNIKTTRPWIRMLKNLKRKEGVDLLEKKTVLPINIYGNHWIVAFAYPSTKKIIVYDPRGETHEEVKDKLTHLYYILHCVKDRDSYDPSNVYITIEFEETEDYDGKYSELRSLPPRQQDGYNCGVFVLMRVAKQLLDLNYIDPDKSRKELLVYLERMKVGSEESIQAASAQRSPRFNAVSSFSTDSKQEENKKEEARQEEDPIKVLSLNACDGGSKISFFSDLKKVAQTDRPDIIFLQEAPKEVAIPGYTVVSVANENAFYERMLCLRRVDSQWTLAKTDVIKSKYCHTPRVCTLHTFLAGKTMLRVASVHLCGGRYDEEVHARKSFEKMKLAKLDMLSSIIKLRPDIVLGDFNSDYFCLPSTIKFLEECGFSNERAQSWSTLPFTALKDNGYIRVPFETATSVFGGQPDQIFHVPELLLKSSTTKDFLSNNSSDHNGLLAQFVRLVDTARQEKELQGSAQAMLNFISSNQSIASGSAMPPPSYDFYRADEPLIKLTESKNTDCRNKNKRKNEKQKKDVNRPKDRSPIPITELIKLVNPQQNENFRLTNILIVTGANFEAGYRNVTAKNWAYSVIPKPENMPLPLFGRNMHTARQYKMKVKLDKPQNRGFIPNKKLNLKGEITGKTSGHKSHIRNRVESGKNVNIVEYMVYLPTRDSKLPEKGEIITDKSNVTGKVLEIDTKGQGVEMGENSGMIDDYLGCRAAMGSLFQDKTLMKLLKSVYGDDFVIADDRAHYRDHNDFEDLTKTGKNNLAKGAHTDIPGDNERYDPEEGRNLVTEKAVWEKDQICVIALSQSTLHSIGVGGLTTTFAPVYGWFIGPMDSDRQQAYKKAIIRDFKNEYTKIVHPRKDAVKSIDFEGEKSVYMWPELRKLKTSTVLPEEIIAACIAFGLRPLLYPSHKKIDVPQSQAPSSYGPYCGYRPNPARQIVEVEPELKWIETNLPHSIAKHFKAVGSKISGQKWACQVSNLSLDYLSRVFGDNLDEKVAQKVWDKT